MEQRPIYVDYNALNEWQNKMENICQAVNIIAKEYEKLGLGDFSKDIFLELFKKGIDFLKSQVPDSTSYTLTLYAIRDGLTKLKDCIRTEQARTHYIQNLITLEPISVPFNANRAEVSADAIKTAEKQLFTTSLHTQFQIELYQKLERAVNAANDAFRFIHENNFYCESILSLIEESERTGSLSINNESFVKQFIT